MRKEKLKERFKDFIQRIEKKDRILVLYHADPDGLCSAVVVSKALDKLAGNVPEKLIPVNYGDFKKIVPKIKKQRFDKVIIVDFTVDQEPELVKELEEKKELLIIDHHKVYNDLNSDKTVFIKAKNLSKLDGAKYPASKLCYDLFSELADLKEFEWQVAVGILGDRGYAHWKEFVDNVLVKHKLRRNKTPYESELGKITELINAAQANKTSDLNKAFELLFNSKKPEQVLKSPLMDEVNKLEKEVDYWILHLYDKAEFYDDLDLIFYLVKPRLRIKSSLINKISQEMYPNKTVIIVMEGRGESLQISARRQDYKVRVNDLLENAVSNLKEGKAGGHIPAAGGSIRKKDLKKFKQNILNLLKKRKNGGF